MVVVVFTEIFMFAQESIYVAEKRKLAKKGLCDIIERNKESFDAVITIDRCAIGKCEVSYISIKAIMEVAPHSLQEVEIEFEKPSLFRRMKLVVLKALRKIDYKDISFPETIAGAAFLIIFRVIVFR